MSFAFGFATFWLFLGVIFFIDGYLKGGKDYALYFMYVILANIWLAAAYIKNS